MEKCPRCGCPMKENNVIMMEFCDSCGYAVPIGEEKNVQWSDSDETEYD